MFSLQLTQHLGYIYTTVAQLWQSASYINGKRFSVDEVNPHLQEVVATLMEEFFR